METKKCKCCGREKPVSEFWKNLKGYTDVCRECANANRHNKRESKTKIADLQSKLDEAKRMRITEFDPRDLMVELKRRGYEFVMHYTEVHTISSDSL